MLTSLRIKNFKAWADSESIRLAPLTILFGSNSSGKSSFGHLMLALKQTVISTDRKRALHLGDESTLIDLGTFQDCLHNHDLEQALEFQLSWRIPGGLTVKNSLTRRESYSGTELALRATLNATKNQQPETAEFAYALFTQGTPTQLKIFHKRKGNSGELTSDPLKLVHAPGRKWPAEAPEKFYRFTDRTLLRYQNADFLAEFALETERMLSQFFYLGPLRMPPKRVYQWSGDTPPDVGLRGESAIAALLAATEANRNLNRGYKQHKQRFDTFIASWLKELGVIDAFEVSPVAIGRKEYEVLVRTKPSSPQVKLTDVGFGVSQVLPALVQSFYASPNSVVWMEQPEIHLHPQVQANLADAFICAVQAYEAGKPRNVQLIVESHSEHFLTRLQRRIAEQRISSSDVAVYFVNQKGAEQRVEALKINEYGEIENWPDGFFGDEMDDVAGRVRAAMIRRQDRNSQLS